MKTLVLQSRLDRGRQSGNTLIMCMVISLILMPLIVASVYMASVQQRTVSLSQDWNASIPIVEAGVEEAFAHLNQDCLIEETVEWSANGWSQAGGVFTLPRRTFADGSYYDVLIITNGGVSARDPAIIAVGSVPARYGVRSYTNNASLTTPSSGPLFATVGSSVEVARSSNINFIKRQVRIRASHRGWPDYGQLGEGQVSVNGTVKSFDSAGGSSFWGKYDPRYAEDNVTVASLTTNVVLKPNSTIYGSLETSPDGTNSLGSGASVGDTNWVNGGNAGIQTNHYNNNLDLPTPTVDVPADMNSWSSLNTSSGGTYTFILPIVTNGSANITTTNYPSPPPPGGLVTTKTNDIIYSLTYYSTTPGPPIDTNSGTQFVTSTNLIPTNPPPSLITEVVTGSPLQWNTNQAATPIVPADGPIGAYNTSPTGTPTDTSYYSSTAGVFTYLKGVTYTPSNCCTNNYVHSDAYVGTITNVSSSPSSEPCCTGSTKLKTQSYAQIFRKVYQTGGLTTNYSFVTNLYTYATRTYTYLGSRTNTQPVTYNYTYIATGGDWSMPSLSLSGSQKMLIRGGHNRIYVRGDFSVTGRAEIVIEPGSSVEWYMGGNVNLAGNGVSNENEKAYQFVIYGLPTCTDVSISGNGRFVGVVLAPDADISFNGGGSRGLVIGSVIGKTITSNGSGVDFVYDEDTKRHFITHFYPTEWIEEAVNTPP